MNDYAQFIIEQLFRKVWKHSIITSIAIICLGIAIVNVNWFFIITLGLISFISLCKTIKNTIVIKQIKKNKIIVQIIDDGEE